MMKSVKESPNVTELGPSTSDNVDNTDIIEVPYDNTNSSDATTSQYSDSSNNEDDIIEESYDDNEDDSPYLYLESKQVLDSDGFYTDYTLYLNTDTGNYICMFGDSDLYEPDEDFADFVTDSEKEAYEWFENYTGFSDDLDESTNPGSIGQCKRCSIDQFTEDDIIEESYDKYNLDIDNLIELAGGLNCIKDYVHDICINYPGIENDYDELAEFLSDYNDQLTTNQWLSILEYIYPDSKEIDEDDIIEEEYNEGSESSDKEVVYPNGMPVTDVDLDTALDYQYGTDRDPDNSTYTNDEKQRAVYFWLDKTDPRPDGKSYSEATNSSSIDNIKDQFTEDDIIEEPLAD